MLSDGMFRTRDAVNEPKPLNTLLVPDQAYVAPRPPNPATWDETVSDAHKSTVAGAVRMTVGMGGLVGVDTVTNPAAVKALVSQERITPWAAAGMVKLVPTATGDWTKAVMVWALV